MAIYFSNVNVKLTEHVYCSSKFQFTFKCPPFLGVGFKYSTAIMGEITNNDITENNYPKFFSNS
jgi:hypothetical protein